MLLTDADLWDWMPDYEEMNLTIVLPSYYPPPSSRSAD